MPWSMSACRWDWFVSARLEGRAMVRLEDDCGNFGHFNRHRPCLIVAIFSGVGYRASATLACGGCSSVTV